MNIPTLLALGLAFSTTFANPTWAADNAVAKTVTGEVLETKEVDAYTYLRLKTSKGESWAAVSKAPIKKGATVTLENVSEMTNFESKTLNKTFPSILFGNLAGSGAADPHAGLQKKPDMSPIKVAKAKGANAYTVAELITQVDKLKDKPVRVSGQVVKYNAGIMGKNWLHLRDGSGSAATNNHDLLVTTTATTQLGDVVTVSGVVRANKDFGAGYSYKVLIEEATLKP